MCAGGGYGLRPMSGGEDTWLAVFTCGEVWEGRTFGEATLGGMMVEMPRRKTMDIFAGLVSFVVD